MKNKIINKLIIIAAISLYVTGCGFQKEDEVIINGYTSCDKYMDDGFMDYTDYCKYYYDEKYDSEFANNTFYKELTADHIAILKYYFKVFPNEFMDEPDKYDFESSCINEGDYYYILNRKEADSIDVYYYDVEGHTLYHIHNNN